MHEGHLTQRRHNVIWDVPAPQGQLMRNWVIDLIPEFLPVIGPLDDIIVVALAFRYAGRQVPREIRLAGDPELLERLLGPARSS